MTSNPSIIPVREGLPTIRELSRVADRIGDAKCGHFQWFNEAFAGDEPVSTLLVAERL
jgi:hypothetical protein